MGKEARKHSIQIFARDLEQGMILTRDVINDRGDVLLTKGFEVQEPFKIKRLLQKHGIFFVSVLKEEIRDLRFYHKTKNREENTDTVLDNHQETEVIHFIEEFSHRRKKLKEAFDKFAKGEAIDSESVEQEVSNALNVFKTNGNIFQLMQKVKHLDDVTYAHCHHVALISYAIGQWMGLGEKDLEELALGGLLIDIGKIRIKDELLNKTETLTWDEVLELRKHVIFGYEIIKDYSFISQRVGQAVLLHHERMDGSGYPMGLKGNKIPLFARIIAIADVYNALISYRPYRKKKTPFEAIRILEVEHKDKLDPKILYLFLSRIASYYIGQKVVLNNGQRGEIIFISKHNIFRPIIKLEDSEKIIDLTKDINRSIDIIEFC